MSQNELHIGKLKEIVLEDKQELETFCQETAKQYGFEELPNDYSSWKELVTDEEAIRKEIRIINNKIYKIVSYREYDPYDDIYYMNKNSDGTIDFIMQFYNGGTCLEECLEEGLNELEKNK